MKLANNLDLDRCPHCSVATPNLSKVGQHETQDFQGGDQRLWKMYLCSKCGGIISAYSSRQSNNMIEYFPSTQTETFDYQYLHEEVAEDFKEALKCYSNQCYNAFGSICRRTIQTSASVLGTKGKDKVKNQIIELKTLADIDEDTYSVLEQIIITGHDGAHPHLPKLNRDRAVILLVLMKDVLNELFIRKARIQESIKLRSEEIQRKNEGS
jgi:hypothetical protein